MLTHLELIQANATYKLTWQGFPRLIMRCSDKNNDVFHPFCAAVCKGESSDNYAFIFNATQQHSVEWLPSIILANASEAIIAGFQSVSGFSKVWLQCFSHVRKNIEKYLKVLIRKGVCGQIIYDLNFHLASELFIGKWKAKKNEHVQDFVGYFQAQ